MVQYSLPQNSAEYTFDTFVVSSGKWCMTSDDVRVMRGNLVTWKAQRELMG